MTAPDVFESGFLPLRGKLLEVAAALDRIERAVGGTSDDPRWHQISQALAVIGQGVADRAQRVQMIFSLPYLPNWKQP